MRFHNITKDDMLNGDGLRVVLWVAGCSHGCKECQNPITWDPNGGIPFTEENKQEIFHELDQDYIDGITFSGGDPLHEANYQEVKALAKEIRQKYPKKTIWLYTGYEWDEISGWSIMKYIDVLVDGKYDRNKRDLKLQWRGSSNQRVIDVQDTIKTRKIVLHTEE